ncbi:hypothetical protein GMST_01140 [Geomonas silvestris]|uniref:Uncharacterized protein n=1 Tax=Geomonas silvestris TaxID=2740184 RepID=A0A6V8MDN2_9BACT|nr:hypothetical protein [Geomonas silvestris]GFO57789.1 hypothetical protein GMST_01140 [Geomonas silvestris]
MTQLLEPLPETLDAAAGAPIPASAPAGATAELGSTVAESAPRNGTETSARNDVCAVHGCAARCARRELPLDLFREGANISAFSLRQSRCLTPLTLSSRAARDLLRQF